MTISRETQKDAGQQQAGGGRRLYSNGGAKPKKSDLTKSENSVKLDMNGKTFKYPEVYIEDKSEYRDVMENIADRYKKYYEGKQFCELEFVNKTYYFENHGFGDYNIYSIEVD